MQEDNKKWSKPKLVILVRGKPGEVVLLGCKRHGYAINTGGPTYGLSDCMFWACSPLPCVCQQCDQNSSS